jgi:excinuclease ABC subunit A
VKKAAHPSGRSATAPATIGEIRIENARSHNLRGVHCRIPLRSLTVITGVSGSGKSTLAFDTLYAEGQRRYVASLSTYARQFLERLPRPRVDRISNLPPAIAIEQRNRVTNARSTVGTATEILDHLRLLYAKIGELRCPDCDSAIEPGTVEAVAGRILERWEGKRISLGAPLRVRRGESAAALHGKLSRAGYTRLLDPQGAVIDLTESSPRQFASLRRRALLLVDRLVPRRGESRARLGEAIANGFRQGEGELCLVSETGERVSFREGSVCDRCGRSFPSPEPALFSFNSPLGACEACRHRPLCDPDGSLPPTRSAARLPAPPDSHQASLRKALGASAWLDFRRGWRPLVWRARLLPLAREEALQGPGARADRALPAFRSVPGVPRDAAAP